MNGAQLHLALNHVPIVLSITGLFILLWGWFRNNTEVKKVGLTIVVAAGLCAVVAFLTGEPAEDILEKLPGFAKDLVHEHEEAGEASLVISSIAGVLALITSFLSWKNHRLAKPALVLTIVATLVASVSFLRTAHLGGVIKHEEIRS